MKNPYSVVTYYEITHEFRDTWRHLWNSAVNATLHNSPDWFDTSISAFPEKKYTVFACYKQNALVGILPVDLSNKFGVRVYTCPAQRFTIDDSLLLQSYESKIMQALIEEVSRRHPLYLPRVKPETARLMLDTTKYSFAYLLYVAPILGIKDKHPLRHLSKSNSKEMALLLKKYSSHLQYINHTYPENLENLFSVMVDIDAHSAKQKKSMDVLTRTEYQHFFRSFIAHYRKNIIITILYFDAKPVAYIFSYYSGKVLVAYQASYLTGYKFLSPGRLLFYLLLNDAQKFAVDTVDFCGGLNHYKIAYAPEFKYQYDVCITKNILYILWWKFIIYTGYVKQRFVKKKYSLDSKYIFRTLRI